MPIPLLHQTAKAAGSQAEGLGCLRALDFVRQNWLRALLISILMIVPCFWHKRIEAGDLASHTYNVWLAQLVETGQAPGLYIVPQSTNILVDWLLLRLGNVLGLAAAEKIVVSSCVLVFFWGAFTLIAAASRRAPWFLVPAIAMIAYGWTFQMGFMNYYLSLGLGFFGTALVWRGHGLDWIVGLVLGVVAWMAHPMGLLCLAGAACYILLAERLAGPYRWALFASALLIVFAVHYYIVHHFPVQYWETKVFYVLNGADQIILFGNRYTLLAMAVVLFGSACFVVDYAATRSDGKRCPFRTPLELWVILLFTAAMIPELIQLPQYPGPVGFPVARLTSITGVMGLCILGRVQPRKWHVAGFAVIAAFFFLWVYHDTSILNDMEHQAETLVKTLPYGRRVIETLRPPPDWRVMFINHLVDRACIGQCFTYANYEPPSGQFRLRVRPGSPIATDSSVASQDMENGQYVVRPEDLPMTQIYQCDQHDFTRLCRHDLSAGEKNGRIGLHPREP